MTHKKTQVGESNHPPMLTLPRMARQQSYTAIGLLIADSQSPLLKSPEGAAEVGSILQRLEEVEIESRDLMKKLLSLVQTDARLERYIKRRLEDPRVSQMWALIEQILAGLGNGNLDISRMLGSEESTSDEIASGGGDCCWEFDSKSVKVMGECGGDMKNERFKCRAFSMDQEETVPPPPPQILETKQPTSTKFRLK